MLLQPNAYQAAPHMCDQQASMQQTTASNRPPHNANSESCINALATPAVASTKQCTANTNGHTGFSATCVCSCTPLYLLASSATSLYICSLLNSAPRAIFSIEYLRQTSTSLSHARGKSSNESLHAVPILHVLCTLCQAEG